MKKKNIFLIPARGGSKRIKNKNIKLFNNHPLISYAIKASKKSKIFDRVIVSTDSKKIAKISIKYGAEIPFLRSKNISTDKSTTLSVIKDVIKRLKLYERYEFICVIYATAVRVSDKDLYNAQKKIKRDKSDMLISVTEFDYPPLRALKINNKNFLEFNWKQYAPKRSQDLPKLIRDAGQFYIYRISSISKIKNVIPKKTSFFMLRRYNAIDIDTPEDLELLKKIYSK